jgi:hypothetical protein
MENYLLQKEFSQIAVQAAPQSASQAAPQKGSSVFPVSGLISGAPLGSGPNRNANPDPNRSFGYGGSASSSPMIYAQNLSDDELIAKLRGHVVEERRVVTVILEYLREVDRRRLYADAGYPSLWDFCIRELGYSEGAASRRINSMRLLRDLPELKKDIEEGKHSLSSLAQAHKFFRTEEKHHNLKMSDEKKKEVLQKLENKTSLECEKELIQLSSVPMQISRPQKERLLDEKHVELKLVIDQKLLLKLKRVQALRSHANPSMNYSDLLNFMADEILKRLDPLEKAKLKEAQTKTSVQGKASGDVQAKAAGDMQAKNSGESQVAVEKSVPTDKRVLAPMEDRRKGQNAIIGQGAPGERKVLKVNHQFVRPPIPEAIRRSVWTRDQGKCGHQDPKTGRECGSRHFLEIDHIRPVSLGGGNEISNLRLRCRGHNQRYAVQMGISKTDG